VYWRSISCKISISRCRRRAGEARKAPRNRSLCFCRWGEAVGGDQHNTLLVRGSVGLLKLQYPPLAPRGQYSPSNGRGCIPGSCICCTHTWFTQRNVPNVFMWKIFEDLTLLSPIPIEQSPPYLRGLALRLQWVWGLGQW
jgi:hypothetical protein